MRITDFAVKNYPFTLIVFLLISVIGAFTVINMPRAEDPELNAPIFPVTIIYPGTSPVDIGNWSLNQWKRPCMDLKIFGD